MRSPERLTATRIPRPGRGPAPSQVTWHRRSRHDFFGLAHLPALRALLYAGAALLVFATLGSGIGLLRSPAGTP